MNTSFAESKLPPISVVMATLGGDVIRRTIEHLNRGSIKPAEILICIPQSDAHKVLDCVGNNIKVIPTECRGQVAQRAVGFGHAIHDFVMQLDDDLVLDSACMESLLRVSMKHGVKTAVGPSMFWTSTQGSFYREPQSKLLLRAYYWLLNGRDGYQPGRITLAGTNVGVDSSRQEREVISVDWVAGGCVLHRRENLVLENFYPFNGKAYCEDIIHSHHLKARGISLLVSARAICWVEAPRLWEPTWGEFLNGLLADLKARRHFVRLSSRSMARMMVYYLVMMLRYAYLKISH